MYVREREFSVRINEIFSQDRVITLIFAVNKNV